MNGSPALSLARVCLIATGGTIAMERHPGHGAPVPSLSGTQLMAGVPGMAQVASVEVVNFSSKPSDHLGPQDWVALKHAIDSAFADGDLAAVVISHGTDTLEETAWFLDLTLADGRPVVLTGAQRNASAAEPDGPANLLDAVRTAVSPGARDKGVLVVLDHDIHAARPVSKTHTSAVDAFKAVGGGRLGQVQDGVVSWVASPSRRQHMALTADELPRVDIVAMYCGADGSLVRAAVAAGAAGIVIQALGLGNVSVAMYEAITAAIAAGTHVAISTRVPEGSVDALYGFVGGGRTLREAGAVFAGDLSPQKARILLMLALQTRRTPAGIQALLDT